MEEFAVLNSLLLDLETADSNNRIREVADRAADMLSDHAPSWDLFRHFYLRHNDKRVPNLQTYDFSVASRRLGEDQIDFLVYPTEHKFEGQHPAERDFQVVGVISTTLDSLRKVNAVLGLSLNAQPIFGDNVMLYSTNQFQAQNFYYGLEKSLLVEEMRNIH